MKGQYEKQYQEYARLLVEVGLNVRKGQTLVIACPVDCAWFARLCAGAAYDVGCREVVMNWRDDVLTRMKYLKAENDVFDAIPTWQSHFFNDYAAQGAAYLAISATDPENLAGVDPDRMVRSRRAAARGQEVFYRRQMANEIPWCVASIPIPAWAKKVFPGMSEKEAMDRLWAAIFEAVRVSDEGGAVERWQTHLALLKERMEKLNALRLESLHYANSLGTDLTIRLPEDHLWAGGSAFTPAGQEFIANMPTEEIFTAPLRDGIDGVVYASLPLCYDGSLIERFHMVVKAGKITEVHAEKGEDVLKAAVSVDEGASRFGEVALVPYHSPISNQKILYYNTLFDENASCHLAFGEAYPECIRGGERMSKEELAAHGLNASDTHVDFMIGTADLAITGRTRDGKTVQIFENGDFVL